MTPILECGPGLRLRQVTEADRHVLEQILAEPDVAQWWPSHDLDSAIAGGPTATFWAIETADGNAAQVVGGAQAWVHDDAEYEHAGIDLFLAPSEQGKGLGRRVVRTIAHWLLEERGHHRIVIDPAAANERAIRCYTSVGFRPVGVMRAYERRADGTWVDGLLMDLLPGDLLRE